MRLFGPIFLKLSDVKIVSLDLLNLDGHDRLHPILGWRMDRTDIAKLIGCPYGAELDEEAAKLDRNNIGQRPNQSGLKSESLQGMQIGHGKILDS